MVRLMKSEKGFSLIEVMIAIALLGIIGVAILGALATASNAMFVADERATAESLARSQIEYIKNQPYAGSYTPEPISDEYEGYLVTIADELIEIGLQKITITIEHHGEEVITLEGYKLDR